MRKNLFGETYLDEGDSVADFITDNEIDAGQLSAFIDPDEDGVMYEAEVLDDTGPVFYVEGYVSELDLEDELRDAGIEFVEVNE